jgi:hypothetical protein
MIQQLTSITAPRKPTRTHDVLTWASDVNKCLRQLIDRGLSGGTGYKPPRAYDQFIPPFYLEPISEFVLRVHPGKLILTVHEWIIVSSFPDGVPDVDVERGADDGRPRQIIPTVLVDATPESLTVYRDLVIPETNPGHPCLTWKTLVSYGDTSLTYVADSAKVEFLETMTWVDPPDYPGSDTETTHIFQLGTYTADAGNTGAISSQLRGNVFYTHEKLWADPPA